MKFKAKQTILIVLMAIFACFLFACAQNDGVADVVDQNTELAIDAYKNGNTDEAEFTLEEMGVSSDSYVCYEAVGIARGIVEKQAAEYEDEKALEVALRRALFSASDKTILEKHIEEILSAARILADNLSSEFESVYESIVAISTPIEKIAEVEKVFPDLVKIEEDLAKLEKDKEEEMEAEMESQLAEIEAERAAEEAEKEAYKNNFDAHLAQQEIFCSDAVKIVSNSEYKALHPDILAVGSITNNSSKTIRDVSIAFACWDSNGYQVAVHPYYQSSDLNMMFGDVPYINLLPGEVWGNDGGGFRLSEETSANIEIVRAIISEVTFTDGSTWKNPLYTEWTELFVDADLV